jgi:hypothetical protein
VRELVKLGIAVGVVAFIGLVIAPMVERQNQLDSAAWLATQEAADAAYRAPFEHAFASGDWQEILSTCHSAINDYFSYVHPPQALAMALDRVDAYVYEGPRRDSLRRVTCSSDGLSQGRIDHPLATLIGVEDDDRDRSGGNLWGEMQMLLPTTPVPFTSIELLSRPDLDAVIRRIISRGPRGWEIHTEPVDAPAFDRLSTSASLLATQAEQGESTTSLPPAAREYPQRKWSAASAEAFEFLERELPEPVKARIAGMRLDDDELGIVIAGPLPDQPRRYATIRFDAWGGVTTWLYPYDDAPSFACPTGISLAQLRQRFDHACAVFGGCRRTTHFSIAFYSCAAAGEGQWRLRLQPD